MVGPAVSVYGNQEEFVGPDRGLLDLIGCWAPLLRLPRDIVWVLLSWWAQISFIPKRNWTASSPLQCSSLDLGDKGQARFEGGDYPSGSGPAGSSDVSCSPIKRLFKVDQAKGKQGKPKLNLIMKGNGTQRGFQISPTCNVRGRNRSLFFDPCVLGTTQRSKGRCMRLAKAARFIGRPQSFVSLLRGRISSSSYSVSTEGHPDLGQDNSMVSWRKPKGGCLLNKRWDKNTNFLS